MRCASKLGGYKAIYGIAEGTFGKVKSEFTLLLSQVDGGDGLTNHSLKNVLYFYLNNGLPHDHRAVSVEGCDHRFAHEDAGPARGRLHAHLEASAYYQTVRLLSLSLTYIYNSPSLTP